MDKNFYTRMSNSFLNTRLETSSQYTLISSEAHFVSHLKMECKIAYILLTYIICIKTTLVVIL